MYLETHDTALIFFQSCKKKKKSKVHFVLKQIKQMIIKQELG